MSRHRAEARPRWGRIMATLMTTSVLLVAFVAGILRGAEHAARAEDRASDVARTSLQRTPTHAPRSTPTPTPTTIPAPTTSPTPTPSPTPTTDTSLESSSTVDATDTTLPADSGTGRRAVFSLSRQRVWIVNSDGSVERTYLVSGSVTDNLQPGTYSVYSRSESAVGVDDSGTMRWFVRFAHGPYAAIGFHDIPVKDGRPLQTLAQLGTPESHGCIRQKESDALAMWDFAQLGTAVVVTA